MTTLTASDLRSPAALIGCAGWRVPRQSASAFPEQGSHLERYAAVFNAVEINSSFYRPHRPATYARWAGCVPGEFRFSVKLPRSVTHEARLQNADALLDQFALEANALGSKLDCVLVQLPPTLQLETGIAAAFFASMSQRFSCMVACEARHPSWFGGEATELLCASGITRVIADPPKGQDGPHVPTAQAIYIRLHGEPQIYISDYGQPFLAQLGADLAGHAAAGRRAWCIFDNTMSRTYVDQAIALCESARAASGLPAS